MARKYRYDNEENEYKEESATSSKLAFLIVGSGIGAALALLFAPKSGRELRGDIADATRKGVDKSRTSAGQLRERSTVYYQQAKGRATDVYEQTADRFRNRRQSVQAGDIDRAGESDLNVLQNVGDTTQNGQTS